MAEENTTPEQITTEENSTPEVDLTSKLEKLEQDLSTKISEKDSKIEELTESLDKMRNRVKRGKKKAKELMSTDDDDQDSPDDNQSSDLEYEFRSFKEEIQFTRSNPEYGIEDVNVVKQISKEKGISLEDAKMIHEYKKMSDPSVKAQQQAKQTQLHGKFHTPSTEPEDDILSKMVLKRLGVK